MAHRSDPAWIILNSWGGLFQQDVLVVGETPQRYRIQAIDKDVRLAGRSRYLRPGETTLVPKHAVTFRG
jgi:hypothetical protein